MPMKATQKQIRMTHSDTILAQAQLSQLLKQKIQSPVLSIKQKEQLPTLTADALLSFGSMNDEIFFTGNGVLNLGSLHSAILRQIDWATSPTIIVKQRGIYFKVDVSKLWAHLYNRCLDWFPLALGEALRHSKEILKREESTGYNFSYDKKIQ